MSTEIGFLLVPQFSSLAFLCAVEPLRVANRLAGRDLYTWRIFSEDGAPIAASNAMRMMADGALTTTTAPPTLIVCAGFAPLQGVGARLPALLRRLAARGVALGAIDTGAFILARAGVLGQAPVTMHWEAAASFREAFADQPVSSDLFEEHGAIFSCAGGTASLDLMLSRIAREHGQALARGVAEQFIHERIREPGAAQRPPPRRRLGNATVARAVGIMEQALERRLDPALLARTLGITTRQLERLFRAHLQTGPAAYHRRLRLARARELLRQTELTAMEVALATGFSARASLSRAYREAYGVSPAADRYDR